MRNNPANFKRVWIFVGFVLLIGFVSALALTVGRGLESAQFFQKFQIYLVFGFIGLGGIIVASILDVGVWDFLIVPLHNPEDSLLPKFKLFVSPLLLTLFSFIAFFPLFFYAGSKQVFFSSIPQQVSAFSNTYSDSLLPALNENLLMFIPIIVIIGLLGFFFLKKSRNPVAYNFGLYIVLPFLMGLLWVAFHNLVYADQQSKQLFTFVFGFVGAFLTVATMSFIPWFVLHFVTNFVLSIRDRGLLSSDIFLFELWAVYFLMVIAFVYFYVNYKKKLRG